MSEEDAKSDGAEPMELEDKEPVAADEDVVDHDEEDVDEDEDEDDDDDEDDDGDAKRQKTSGGVDFSRFLDLEAEADDDEDEEDGEAEDGFVEAVADEVAGRESTGAHHRLLNFSQDVEKAAMDDAALEERFGYYDDPQGDGEVVDTVSIPTQGLQPSLMDPKMWMVKTKPGKEKEAVIHLMNRYFLKRELGENLQVFSVTAPEHTKGFIFVEADKEPSVRAAIHGVPNVFSFSSTLVPIAQMTSVLRVSSEKTDVRKGQWVRMKRGKYTGDLGKVVEIDPSGLRLEVKFIPRIDPSTLAEERQKAASGVKRGRKKTDLASRPKQRPFNADEMSALNETVRMEEFNAEENVQLLSWNGDRFDERGYMYKWWNIKGLEVQDVHPSLDELQMFHARDGTEDLDVTAEQKMLRLAKEAQVDRSSTVTFMKGDAVIVKEGGEAGLTGKVKEVNNNIVTVILDSAPGETTQLVEQYEAKILEKHFRAGDHIKVLAGVHKGETGLVSNVVDNVVWVVDDSSLETFTVLKSDVQKSISVATGQLKLGNYSLHDMVRLANLRTVGVIVKIDKEHFRILDQNGEVHTIPLQGMGAKVHSRDPVSFDKNHESVTQGDLLKVVEGPFRGKQGKVIHIYRFYAFLECREVLSNNGIINVKTDHCQLLGSNSRRRRDTSFTALGPNPLMSPGNLKQQMGGPVDVVTKVYSKSKKRDDIIGKRGTIIKGSNKAHRGTVRNATEEHLTIVLEATRRSVKVPRDQFRVDGQAAPTPRYESSLQGGFGAMAGWQTPSHQQGMQTPARPMTPGVTQTPLRGDEDEVWNPMHQTPQHASAAWNVNDEVGMDMGMGGSSVDPNDRQGWTPSSTGEYGQYAPSSYSSQYPTAPTPYDANTPGMGLGSTPGYGASPYVHQGNTPSYPASQYGMSPHTMQQSPNPMQSSPYYAQASPMQSGSPMPLSSSPAPYGSYGNMQPTPQYPLTTPATPSMGMPAAGPPVPVQMPEHWQHPQAVVRLDGSDLAVVVSAPAQDSQIVVEVASTGERRTVLREKTEPVKPEAQDRVVVLAGPHMGQYGELTAVDRTGEALVKLTGTMTLVPIEFLCKSRRE